jgi:hypothetical protein
MTSASECIECQVCHAEAEKERKNVVIDENVNEILIFYILHSLLHIYGVCVEEGETMFLDSSLCVTL